MYTGDCLLHTRIYIHIHETYIQGGEEVSLDSSLLPGHAADCAEVVFKDIASGVP